MEAEIATALALKRAGTISDMYDGIICSEVVTPKTGTRRSGPGAKVSKERSAGTGFKSSLTHDEFARRHGTHVWTVIHQY